MFARTVTEGQYQLARHVKLIDKTLCQVALGKIKRLIIEAPPRHSKTETCSKWFPAWWLGTNPTKKILLASYSDTYARKLGRQVRNIIDEHGPKYFGIRVDPEKRASGEWYIDGFGGCMNSAGIDGRFTGLGADLLLIDDLVKNQAEAASEAYRNKVWDWWLAVAKTRLETTEAACVIVMTRWHRHDLIGRLRDQGEEIGQPWTIISLPALADYEDPLGREPGEPLWPERFDKAHLEQVKKESSTYSWNALYQQKPSVSDRCEWSEDYFEGITVKELPKDKKIECWVMTIDPSLGKDKKRGDYSAIVLLGITSDSDVYVVSDLQRRGVGQMVEDALKLASKYNPAVIQVEGNGFQELVVPELNRLMPTYGNRWNVTSVVNTLNKNFRISSLDSYLRNKELKFVEGPSNTLLINQLREFPNGVHDDGPDALAAAVKLLHQAHQPKFDDGLGDNIFG